jgi:hypothetical protein
MAPRVPPAAAPMQALVCSHAFATAQGGQNHESIEQFEIYKA